MGARNIFGALVIALALFSFWPFVVGRFQQTGALREALAERQALVAERQQALENFTRELDRFQTQLSGDDKDKFAAIVPEKKSTAELLSALDAIANSTGVRLLEANISELKSRRRGTSTTTKTLVLSLDLEGRYESFRAFLGQLERSVRLLDVQSLDVAEGELPGELIFDVEARAYFLQ